MTQKKRSGAKTFVPIGFNILASLLIFFYPFASAANPPFHLCRHLIANPPGSGRDRLDQSDLQSWRLGDNSGSVVRGFRSLTCLPVQTSLEKPSSRGGSSTPDRDPTHRRWHRLIAGIWSYGHSWKGFRSSGHHFYRPIGWDRCRDAFVSVPLLVNTSRQAFRQLIVIWNKPPRSMARLPGRLADQPTSRLERCLERRDHDVRPRDQ